MAGKKILMLVGDFSEEYEIFVFEQAMQAVGHHGRHRLPRQEGGRNPARPRCTISRATRPIPRSPATSTILTKTFSRSTPADYDAVYVAGGRGPEYIRIDKRVQAIIRHFHQADKPIFTICHGVQVLMAVPETIRGKKVAALQYCEPEVTAPAASISTCRRPAPMSTASWCRRRAGPGLAPSCANA